MESIAKSDKSLISTYPIPPKYQTNMVIRVKEGKKGKASAENYEPRQVQKKNKAKKYTFEGSFMKFRKEEIVIIDEEGNGEE